MKLAQAKSAALLENLTGNNVSVQIGEKDNCWLGLFTTMPAADGTGGIEPSPTKNYARIEIHTCFTNFNNYSVTNSRDINCNAAIVPSDPTAASGADWGEIVGFGLFASDNAITPYAWGELTEPVTVNTQSTLHFLAGKFTITDAGTVEATANA